MKLLTTTAISLLFSLQSLAASDYSLQEKLTCAANSMYIYNFPLAMARSAPGQEKEVQYIKSIQLTWYTTILNNLIETEKTTDEARKIIKAEIDKSTTKINHILKDANQKNFNELFETNVLPIQIECNRKFIEKSE